MKKSSAARGSMRSVLRDLRRYRHRLKGWLLRSLLYGVTVAALPAHADRSVPEDFATQMPGSDHTASLGPDVFGDSTDLYSGATRFVVTDVSLPGNSDLPVVLQRSLEASDSGLGIDYSPYGMPDTFMTWTRYEVPHINGVYPDGWVASVGYDASNQRCSLTSGPPEIKDGKGLMGSWERHEYWHGNHLYLPESGSQLMLAANTTNAPTDGPTYVWSTKDHWYFSCLPTTANGQPGEAFVARSPDGKTYYFNHLVNWRPVATLRKFDEEDDEMVMGRDEYRMLLTRVEDRFGNWVQYTYSGKDLTAITANDGRQLTMTYAAPGGALTSVTDGTRTWTYNYTSGVRVTFPDSTVWQSAVSGPGIRRNNLGHPDGSVSCDGATYTGELTLTIQQRSGAFGTFVFRPLRRGVSHVFYNPYASDPCPHIPKNFDNIALYSKMITGSGLTNATWTYVYGPANGCFAGSSGPWNSTPCMPSSPTTRYVEVYGPGVFTRYTFGNRWEDTDGALLLTETGASPTSILRSDAVNWQTFPAPGYIPQIAGGSQLSAIVRTIGTQTITQDGAAHTTTNSNWDAYFNPQTVVESGPNGGSRTTQYTYYNDRSKWVIGQVASKTFPGKSMSRSFNTNASISAVVEDGVTTSYTYHTDGTIATITYPRSLVHSFSNYKRGVAQSESQPEGVNLTRVVSDAGFITSETDGENRVFTYGYDSMGRITAIDHPRGNDVTISYTGATKATKTTTRGPLVQVVSYDALWRPISIARAGIVTNHEYDAYGRGTFVSNPGETIGTRSEYDALGRVAKVTHPDATYRSLTFGAGSITTRDERGNYTTRTYRAYGDPADKFLVGVAAPEASANMTIERATNGLIMSIAQAGRTRTFGYDTRNYLTSETHPETGTTTFERDAAGNMAARIVGSLRADYAYDGLNRLTSVTYSDSTPAIAQTWSKTSKLRSVTSSAAARVLGYDEHDNVTSESLTIASTVLSAQYGYDGNDQLATITYPVSQRVVSYSPDALGRPTQVSGYASAVTYWPSGLVRQINYANGIVTNYDHNSRLWPSTFSTRRGSAYSLNSTYGYDGAGNLTSITDTIDGNMNRSLGYDAIDRLTSASGPWGAGTVAYDGAGNITSQSFGPFSLGYTYDGLNRLASVSGSRSSTYSYDALGNISAASGATYSYDAVPNMRCVNCGGINRTDYAYDGLRNRVTVAKSGTTSYEFYSFKGELLVEHTPSQSNKLVEYVYLNGKRISQRVSDQRPATSITPIATTVLTNSSDGVVLGVNVGGQLPTGSVAFARQSTALGTAYVADGQASIEVVGLTGGTHSITASYSGDANNSANSLTYQLQVIDTKPASISVPTSSANGSYTVSWGAAGGTVTAYELYEATNSSFTGQVRVYNGTALSTAISGRGDGAYFYRARACNGSTCSAYRTGANSVTVLLPPTTPASISVPSSSTNGAYTITWGVAGGSVARYELYEATNSSFSGEVIVHNAAALSVALSGRGNGTYYYRVRACNASGCGPHRAGANSMYVTLPPGTPSSISVPTMSGSASHTISWGAASGVVTSYQLFEATNPSFSGETQAYGGTGTSIALSGRETGTYYYRVRACNVNACSGLAVGANGIIVTKPPGPPAWISVPASNSTGTYTISWGLASGEFTSYQLYESTDPNFSSSTQLYGSTGTSMTVSNRTNGTYYYRARACNGSRIPGACSEYVTASNGVNVSVQVLVASVSSAYWSWYGVRRGDVEISPDVVVYTSGGAGGNTYQWQRVSGDTAPRATAPSSSATGWTGREWDTYGVSYTSIWRCLVTDSLGNTTYTPNVTVTFRADNDE